MLNARLFAPSLLILGLAASGAEAATRTARQPTAPAQPAATPPAPGTEIHVVAGENDSSIPRPELISAPTDDFERVAWCYGALSGHMELAEVVAPLEPVNEDIQSIGRSYLRTYEAALTLSRKGETAEGRARAEAARVAGYNAWTQAKAAPIDVAARLYDTWQLPGDCEHASIRISGHPALFAEMATDEEADLIHRTLTSSGQTSASEIQAPRILANTVNAETDPDAPIATNRSAPRSSAPLPPVPVAVPVNTPPPASAPQSTPATTPQSPDKPRKASWWNPFGIGGDNN